jgi:hypothetical protein
MVTTTILPRGDVGRLPKDPLRAPEFSAPADSEPRSNLSYVNPNCNMYPINDICARPNGRTVISE